MFGFIRKFTGLAGALIAMMSPVCAEQIQSAILIVETETPLPISRLDLPPENLHLAGARLAIEDNQTTGRFQNQTFVMQEIISSGPAAVDGLRQLMAAGIGIIGVVADAETLLELSAVAGDDALLLNISAADNRLRQGDCRTNILHLAPSRAMLSDALMQYLIWKRWTRLNLISGSHPQDTLLAQSLTQSARKFGARLQDHLIYEDTGGARRTDTGHIQVQRQMPVFTQKLKKSDVILVADENEVFGSYLPYHSWSPSLIAGSSGLVPTSWHPGQEAWGATQIQRRFERANGRRMRPGDYQAWMAFRVVGEAASRTGSADIKMLKAYILGPEFELAGFKGQKLTFRDWNGQLRQPILLTHDKVLVSVSPQDGFLHQTSMLDTLGQDRSESTCTAFEPKG